MKHEAYFESPYKYLNIEDRIFAPKEGEEMTTNIETGELYVMRKVAKDKRILHDSLVYTKLFQDSIHQMCELSSSALKVMLYAMATVRPLSETVVLNSPDVMLFCRISKTSVYEGTMELLDKRIISKKLGSNIEFWFDPNVFFNGNRIKVLNKRSI